MMWLARFRFHTWSINRMYRGSGVEIFSFCWLTQFGYLYVKVGPASEPETCALIGYPRVKNEFFSIPTLIPHKIIIIKKEMLVACIISYLNCFFFVMWINAFLTILAKTEVTDSSQMKTKQSKNHNETKRFIWSFHGAGKYFVIM